MSDNVLESIKNNIDLISCINEINGRNDKHVKVYFLIRENRFYAFCLDEFGRKLYAAVNLCYTNQADSVGYINGLQLSDKSLNNDLTVSLKVDNSLFELGEIKQLSLLLDEVSSCKFRDYFKLRYNLDSFINIANRLKNFAYNAQACQDYHTNLDSICVASINESIDEFVATNRYRCIIYRPQDSELNLDRELSTGSKYSGSHKVVMHTQLINVIEAARKGKIHLGNSIEILGIKDSVIFRSGEGNLLLFNMDNNFVNYSALAKYDYSLSFTANIDDLKRAIVIISYVANATDQVRCRFMIDTERQSLLMVIIGKDNSVSCNAVISINIEHMADNNMKTCSFYANPLYILDFIKLNTAIKSKSNSSTNKRLLFSLSEDELVPLKISRLDNSYMYYLMKMKNNL